MAKVPKELGGWRLGACLGEGACGGVYEATKGDSEGACKLAPFKDRYKKNEIDYTNLIANESIFLTRMKPEDVPYLPRMLQDCTTTDGWTFIVLEKFSNGSLLDYVRKRTNTPLSIPFVCAIGCRLVKCLEVVHRAGWFHLDIKPGNVMIADDPRRGVALIDFGLSIPTAYAKLRPRSKLEGSYPFLGTHVWNMERESPRDDLEAVGLTMAWLLRGGNLPWSDKDVEEMKRQIQNPRMPQNVTKEPVVQDYLKRVRRLHVDEAPDYEELLELLALQANDYLNQIVFPSSPVKVEQSRPRPSAKTSPKRSSPKRSSTKRAPLNSSTKRRRLDATRQRDTD